MRAPLLLSCGAPGKSDVAPRPLRFPWGPLFGARLAVHPQLTIYIVLSR